MKKFEDPRIEKIKYAIGWPRIGKVFFNCHEKCQNPHCSDGITFEHQDDNFIVHHTHKLTEEMNKKFCDMFEFEQIALVIIDGPYMGEKEADYNLTFYNQNREGKVTGNFSRYILKSLNHFVDVNKMVE